MLNISHGRIATGRLTGGVGDSGAPCANVPDAVQTVGLVGQSKLTPAVNVTLLLGCPLRVSTSGPAVAPTGTRTVTAVSLQVCTFASVPLNVTVLVPCDWSKFDPEM